MVPTRILLFAWPRWCILNEQTCIATLVTQVSLYTREELPFGTYRRIEVVQQDSAYAVARGAGLEGHGFVRDLDVQLCQLWIVHVQSGWHADLWRDFILLKHETTLDECGHTCRLHKVSQGQPVLQA